MDDGTRKRVRDNTFVIGSADQSADDSQYGHGTERAINIGAQALGLVCVIACVIAALITRTVDVLLHIAVLARAPTLVILALGFASCMYYAFRVYALRQAALYKRRLFNAGFMLGCAMLALPLTQSAVGILELHKRQTVTIGKDFLRISGAIASSLDQILQGSIDPSLPLDRVELENEGGDVGGALRAGIWLQKRGIKRAVVTGNCASACAYLAMMFPERLIAPAGRLGFHDVQSHGETKEAQESRAALLDAITRFGIQREVATTLFSTRALRWPSLGELLSDHLVTGCWNPDSKKPENCQEGSIQESAITRLPGQSGSETAIRRGKG